MIWNNALQEGEFIMYCSFCGSPQPDGSRFCSACGMQISASSKNQPNQNMSAFSDTDSAPGNGAQTSPINTMDETTAKSATVGGSKTAVASKNGFAVKIGVAVVAAALVGGVGAFMLSDRSSLSDTEEPVSVEAAEAEEEIAEVEEEEEIILEIQEEADVEEAEDEEIIVEPIDPPANEEMTVLFDEFNTFGCVGDIDSFAAGELTVDQALVLTAMSLYGSEIWLEQYYANGGIVYDDTTYYDIIDYDVVESYVQNLFGEEMAAQIDSCSAEIIPSHLWGNENNAFPFVIHTDAGDDFRMYLTWDWGEDASGSTTIVQGISETDTNGIFEVQVAYATLSETSYDVLTYSCLVQKSEKSDYGWIILSMEDVSSTDSYDWAALYASYLADKSDTQGTYTLIYLNDDTIPELYYEGISNGDGYTIYYIDNGVVESIECTYEPTSTVRGGYVYDAGGKMGYVWDLVYYLDSDGTLSVLFDGACEYDIDTDKYSNHTISGVSVSEKEYNNQLAAVTSWEADDSYNVIYLSDIEGFEGGSAILKYLKSLS